MKRWRFPGRLGMSFVDGELTVTYQFALTVQELRCKWSPPALLAVNKSVEVDACAQIVRSGGNGDHSRLIAGAICAGEQRRQ